jgi:hypothetical protein
MNKKHSLALWSCVLILTFFFASISAMQTIDCNSQQQTIEYPEETMIITGCYHQYSAENSTFLFLTFTLLLATGLILNKVKLLQITGGLIIISLFFAFFPESHNGALFIGGFVSTIIALILGILAIAVLFLTKK